MIERLDRATRELLRTGVSLAWERNPRPVAGVRRLLAGVNEMRAPELPPIELREIESYPGQYDNPE
jgi:hypothetical protein